jgi:hypothetical protein
VAIPDGPLAHVYRSPDGQWHFACECCPQMNGFEHWSPAFQSARLHLAFHAEEQPGLVVLPIPAQRGATP